MDTVCLNETRIGDGGAAHLGKVSTLTSLKLDGTRITDAGLAKLGGLAALDRLHLLGTPITDKGLPCLLVFPGFQDLRISADGHAGRGWLLAVSTSKNEHQLLCQVDTTHFGPKMVIDRQQGPGDHPRRIARAFVRLPS